MSPLLALALGGRWFRRVLERWFRTGERWFPPVRFRVVRRGLGWLLLPGHCQLPAVIVTVTLSSPSPLSSPESSLVSWPVGPCCQWPPTASELSTGPSPSTHEGTLISALITRHPSSLLAGRSEEHTSQL